MDNKNEFFWFETAFTLIKGAVSAVILVWLFKWLIENMIHSYRTKDEDFQRDCVVIPICVGIFGVSMVGLGIAWLAGFR